jgi:hypothetical protein
MAIIIIKTCLLYSPFHLNLQVIFLPAARVRMLSIICFAFSHFWFLVRGVRRK